MNPKNCKNTLKLKKQMVYVDISDLYKSKAKTGIQRVVREITSRLSQDKRSQFELGLLNFNAQNHKYELFSNTSVKDFMLAKKDTMVVVKSFKIEELVKGSIFFDIDSAWNIPLKRPYLYKKLKKINIQIISYIYDLVPIIYPYLTHQNTLRNFVSYLSAVYAYSDIVLCDSRSTERDFLKYKEDYSVGRHIPTMVTKLGIDFKSSDRELNNDEINLVKNFINKKYILFVGTIEPRKKQKLAVDSISEIVSLGNKDIHLVIAGREGWNSNNLVNYIKKHPLYNKNIHWLDTPSDELLDKLYKNCYMSMYLSEYEGFGLPIGESLGYGKITITSRNSSTREVGKDFADYTVYNTRNEIIEIIDNYIKNDNLYKKRCEYIRNEYNPYTWSSVYETILQFLNRIKTVDELKFKKTSDKTMQAVIISNDVDKLSYNIKLLDKKARFIKEYIIIAPRIISNRIYQIKSHNKIVFIDEREVLASQYNKFKISDHLTKNWMLRSNLVKIDQINLNFIMIDDDNQPLDEVFLNTFINEDGTYNAYYFYDLIEWFHRTTAYDLGQLLTSKILDEHNLELLMYSSHQPQIINKRIFTEALKEYGESVINSPIDEWSAYFNYAITRYPSLFRKKVFVTMNWPARPTDWQYIYRPSKYIFENYYSHLYTDKAEAFYGVKNNDTLTKLKIKEKTMKPFYVAIDINQKYQYIINQNDIAHGILEFNFNNSTMYLHSVPYLIITGKKACIRLNLDYELIGDDVDNNEIFLCCEARGTSLSQRELRPIQTSVKNYYHGTVSLPIVSRNKTFAVIDFFLVINGERIYNNNKSISRLLAIGDINDNVEDAIVKNL
ncbi:MAG: glycosyltransferase family 1 protein [Candidatus Saccharimonadales bacterium]